MTISWGLTASLAGFWEGTVMDNFDETASCTTVLTEQSLKLKDHRETFCLEMLELTRQHRAPRQSGNNHLSSELAKLC